MVPGILDNNHHKVKLQTVNDHKEAREEHTLPMVPFLLKALAFIENI
jgi:hypothetical protein